MGGALRCQTSSRNSVLFAQISIKKWLRCTKVLTVSNRRANEGTEAMRIWERQPQSFVNYGSQFSKMLFSVKVMQVPTGTNNSFWKFVSYRALTVAPGATAMDAGSPLDAITTPLQGAHPSESHSFF